MKTLLFASANAHKIAEINQLLQPVGYEVKGLQALGFEVEIPETGSDLHENAGIKASFLHKETGFDCFADDTGLEVAALHGAPGVFSARYAGEPRSDQRNMEKLLDALKELPNEKQRLARFRTVMCLILNGKTHHFEGIVNGQIGLYPVGTAGFGYDPLFIPTEGNGRSFAQMTGEEKNAISHRARAMTALVEFLKANDV
jgi:XTP/dITP diphosphohydrolase